MGVTGRLGRMDRSNRRGCRRRGLATRARCQRGLGRRFIRPVQAVAIPESGGVGQAIGRRLPGLSHRLCCRLNLAAAGLLQQLLLLLSHLLESLQLLGHRRVG